MKSCIANQSPVVGQIGEVVSSTGNRQTAYHPTITLGSITITIGLWLATDENPDQYSESSRAGSPHRYPGPPRNHLPDRRSGGYNPATHD